MMARRRKPVDVAITIPAYAGLLLRCPDHAEGWVEPHPDAIRYAGDQWLCSVDRPGLETDMWGNPMPRRASFPVDDPEAAFSWVYQQMHGAADDRH